jgi:hypothetical protein
MTIALKYHQTVAAMTRLKLKKKTKFYLKISSDNKSKLIEGENILGFIFGGLSS